MATDRAYVRDDGAEGLALVIGLATTAPGDTFVSLKLRDSVQLAEAEALAETINRHLAIATLIQF